MSLLSNMTIPVRLSHTLLDPSEVLVTAITSIEVVMEVLLHRKPVSTGNLELFFFACSFPSFILWKRRASVNFLLLWRTCMCPNLDV